MLKRLKLPTPHTKQTQILQSKAKRKVIVAGRQVGKTMLAGMELVGGPVFGTYGFLDGAHTHYSATTEDQSGAVWDYVTKWLRPLEDSPDYYKNETKRLIEFNGGRIRVKTGRNPHNLRGGNVDKLIFDECAYLDPLVWEEVGPPMLLVRNGVAVFLSTPKRQNWFFRLYQRAIDPGRIHWAGFNFATTENPYMTQEAWDLLTEDMTEENMQQEIYAQFLEGEGAVFRRVSEVCRLDIREPYGGRFVMGLDWGQQQDYTVAMVMDRDTCDVVDYDRFNKIGWAVQRGRIAALQDRWQCEAIWAENNSIGSPNIEALLADGLPVFPFETTAKSKAPLIESLVLAFERDEVAVIDDPVIVGELMAYERTTSKATLRPQYNAPQGMHDDCVIALALANHGRLTNTKVTQLSYNPFMRGR